MPDIEGISGVAVANIESISGKAIANVAKFAGVTKAAQSGGGIVTDNLYQHYDASDSNSYPGTGTTWTDLQGNYNVTLYGGPQYNSSQPSHFDFDQVNDRARGATDYGANSSDMTVEVWFRQESRNSYRQTLSAALETTTTNRRFLINIERYGQPRFIMWNTSGSGMGTNLSTTTFSLNTWYHIACTKIGNTSSIYIDGSLNKSITLSGTLGTCNVFGIGERQLASQDVFNGDIARVRVYSDGLTSSEVTQNYDAEKAYFGKT